MMNDATALHKIWQIRESEKKKAEQAHQQSIQDFERIAMKMYEILKKKEATEEAYEKNIQSIISIEKMEQHTKYIEQLQQQIASMQQLVNDARNTMNQKQQVVTSAHIEMKKVEKLIEKRAVEAKQRIKKEENAFMDELSMQQFLKRKLGESIV